MSTELTEFEDESSTEDSSTNNDGGGGGGDESGLDGHKRVTMQRFNIRTGLHAGNQSGFKFTVTDALASIGVTAEKMKDGMEAAIRFHEPAEGGGILTGFAITGDDVEGGRSAENQMTVVRSKTSLNIYIPFRYLDRMGIEYDTEDNPPTLMTWAGDGAIAFRTPEVKQITHEVDNPLSHLSPIQREDYRNVHINGMSFEEAAEARGMEKAQYQTGKDEGPTTYPRAIVKQNVERAISQLEKLEPGLHEKIKADGIDPSDREGGFKEISRVPIRGDSETGYLIAVTNAIRHALPEEEHNRKMGVTFNPGGAGEGVVPGAITVADEDGELPTGSWTDNFRTVENQHENGRMRLRIPRGTLEFLGIDYEDAEGTYLNLLASDESRAIAITTPASQSFMLEQDIDELNLIKRDKVGFNNQQIRTFVETAVGEVDGDLTREAYEEWRATHDGETPSAELIDDRIGFEQAVENIQSD